MPCNGPWRWPGNERSQPADRGPDPPRRGSRRGPARAARRSRPGLDEPARLRLPLPRSGAGRPGVPGDPLRRLRRLVDRLPARPRGPDVAGPPGIDPHARERAGPPRALLVTAAGSPGERSRAEGQERLPQRAALPPPHDLFPGPLEPLLGAPAPRLPGPGRRAGARPAPPDGPPLRGLPGALRDHLLAGELRLADVSPAPLDEHHVRHLYVRRPLPGGDRRHRAGRGEALPERPRGERHPEAPARSGEAPLRLQHLLGLHLGLPIPADLVRQPLRGDPLLRRAHARGLAAALRTGAGAPLAVALRGPAAPVDEAQSQDPCRHRRSGAAGELARYLYERGPRGAAGTEAGSSRAPDRRRLRRAFVAHRHPGPGQRAAVAKE